MSCNCFVAQHPQAAAIDAALGAGEDPRRIAERFGIGKSKVYEHRGHLRAGATPGREGATVAPAEPGGTAAPPPPKTPAAPPAKPAVERSMENVERRMESGGTVSTAPAITSRALPSEATPAPTATATLSPYATAVAAAMELVTTGKWRPAHVEALSQRFGIARNSARAAHAEATRHLQMNMGDYAARQAVSAAYVTRQRDDAKAQSAMALRHADQWREREHEAEGRAAKKDGDERFAALKEAAHFGLLATKYDLSAEKWSAQALAHQRHLDDILCLRSPREMTQNNFAIGSDGLAMLERFGAALAARFADRPDVAREIDETASAVAGGSDSVAIDTTGEAA